MTVEARVDNKPGMHRAVVRTDGREQHVSIEAKSEGAGSRVNGGELLFLALATCYCNDVYREATRQGIDVRSVEVEVEGRFGGVGEPARDVRYRAKVTAAGATESAVRLLLARTDEVAEVHNTLRSGTPVLLDAVTVSLVDAETTA